MAILINIQIKSLMHISEYIIQRKLNEKKRMKNVSTSLISLFWVTN